MDLGKTLDAFAPKRSIVYRPRLAPTLDYLLMRLLIVEDDVELASALRAALAQPTGTKIEVAFDEP